MNKLKSINTIRMFIGISILLYGCSHQAHQLPGAMSATEPLPDCQFTPANSVHCGRTPTTTIDNNGRLWSAYVVGEHVYMSYSDDMGRRYSPPVKVNAEPEEIYTNGENRAKVAIGKNGEVYVSWTVVRDGPFFGDIRFSRSLDGGKNFEPVRTVNDDGLLTSHRFESMFVDSAGNIYLAWLDKRDLVASKNRGEEYNGAALYYTVSSNNGRTFSRNLKVADYSCECCRIALSETADGNIAAFWRHIFGESTRDHGFAILSPTGVISFDGRITDDDWEIEACPHHGPSMVTGSDSTYHLTWFTLGEKRKGIFYGRYNYQSKEIDNLKTVATTGSSHPYIAKTDGTLYLVWKQFDGEKTSINMMVSRDDGENWDESGSISSTAGASDHPLLISDNEQLYLSWHTEDEGLRLINLNNSGR
ncbi:MAG: exo-alpha-sialidase [Gammaproteobacteria bacterium]|nr:exo-alpha-sialidase [Gammaproteobacteria bacterium]